jgi:hypothetical protein
MWAMPAPDGVAGIRVWNVGKIEQEPTEGTEIGKSAPDELTFIVASVFSVFSCSIFIGVTIRIGFGWISSASTSPRSPRASVPVFFFIEFDFHASRRRTDVAPLAGKFCISFNFKLFHFPESR